MGAASHTPPQGPAPLSPAVTELVEGSSAAPARPPAKYPRHSSTPQTITLERR
ncbi:MAG: hypothetical protein AAGF95_25945 [Chloroflexota bacterium]